MKQSKRAFDYLSPRDKAIHIWKYASEHGAEKTIKAYGFKRYEYEAFILNGETFYQERV